jgi:hypothetical protein
MVVDKPSEGALGIGVAVLASFETLLPLFDGDERRTILYLQHVMGEVLKRPYELAFKTLSERKDPLDKIDKVCRAEEPFYGASWDIGYERPRPDLFEMNVRRCFWHDFFARHDAMLVTTVMCSWDTNWMRAIDPAVSGLRAERTSLLSLGDDQCRFAVWRPRIPWPATATRSSSDSSTTGNPADGVIALRTGPRRGGGPDEGQAWDARPGCARSARKPGGPLSS